MFSFSRKTSSSQKVNPSKKKKKRLIIIIVALFILFFGGIFLWFGPTLFKVAPNAGLASSLLRSLPGVSNELKATEEGRTNIVLLGMRGEGVEGGGLLADTIMVASLWQEGNDVSLMSIPRDLYVTVPGTNEKRKINAVHALGEEKGRGEGLEDMKTILSEVLGQEMHYAVSINFAGFEQMIDALGGVDVDLVEAFIEPVQFHEERVCDEHVFTVPSGNFEEKISGRTGRVKARYPLCYNSDEECGGVFEVPAGKSTLSGEQTLCYVRARATSSDFDRARRQQEVLKELKEKALSLGMLTDIEKMNALRNALGNNFQTDMQLWEMKKFLERAQTLENPTLHQRVLENSEEGLLYHPEETPETGYILLPRGESYTRIHEAFSVILPHTLSETPSE
jgi:LCP family protein required for cell wall assembly